jgi:hypothetical protein
MILKGFQVHSLYNNFTFFIHYTLQCFVYHSQTNIDRVFKFQQDGAIV